jgi:hypothetical protein
MRGTDETVAPTAPEGAAHSLAKRGQGDAAHSIVPAAIAVPLPDTEAPRGLLMQWKRGKIDRATALKAIQSQYDAQLEALRYQLSRAVTVSNARADRIAEEFLQKLDSEHLQVLQEFGLRNFQTRMDALTQATQMVAAKLRELDTKDWPPDLVDKATKAVMELHERVNREMMKELGGS